MRTYFVMHGQRTTSWTTREIERNTVILGDPVIRADMNNGLHVAFRRTVTSPSLDVRLAYGLKRDAAAWTFDEVSPPESPQKNVAGLAMTVRGNKVVLAYDGNGTTPAEGYRTWIGWKALESLQWSLSAVGAEATTSKPGVAIDGKAASSVTYYDSKYRSLRFSNLSTAVDLETNVAADNVGYLSQIAFDPSDGIHVVAGGPTIRHFYRASGQTTWSPSTIANASNAHLRLAVDSSGGAHVLFADGSTYRYAYRPAGGTWAISDVGATSSPAYNADMMVDGRGVHVAYVESPGEVLHYGFLCRAR